jgi:hypothetical protein
MKPIAAVPFAAFALLVVACSAQNPTILSTIDAGAASDDSEAQGSSVPSTATVTVWGDMGKPCTLEDEADPSFSGYALTEVNIESWSAQCATRICLANHYQGRVSCPVGQLAAGAGCVTPGQDSVPVTVPVQPACSNRPAADAVYCSCRCDGPASDVPLCRCGQGFTCTKLLEPIPSLGSLELAGSYCVRDGTEYDQQTFRCEP